MAKFVHKRYVVRSLLQDGKTWCDEGYCAVPDEWFRCMRGSCAQPGKPGTVFAVFDGDKELGRLTLRNGLPNEDD